MADVPRLGDVELLPGEVPQKSWAASGSAWGPFPGYGRHHLTNQRLVWIKSKFNPLPVRNHIVVGLDDIDRCDSWSLIVRQFTKVRLTSGRGRSFEIHWGYSGAKVASDINAVLQERHADHG